MRSSNDEHDDDDSWDEENYDDDDDGYIACPNCGEMMLEAADYCPACDRWITTEDVRSKRHPWWVVAVVLLLVVILLFSAVGF